MSDYEIIMLLLQVITVVIAFGALIALICLTKDKQPFISTNLEISIKRKGHFSKSYIFRDEPDVTTRLAIFLYYNKVMIYRQIMMNVCMAHNLMMQWKNKKNSYWLSPIGAFSFMCTFVCSFRIFFYIIPLNDQELPVEPVVYPWIFQ